MEKKWLAIIIIILIICCAFALVYFLFIKKDVPKSPVTPSAENLEICKTLYQNNENLPNIVFLSSKEQAEMYYNSLISTSPFDKNKDKLNFYYIDSYTPQCELYEGIALLCYNKELIKKAASCPNDIIVAVKEQPLNIRSSAYMNVISLNPKLQDSVFAHELGHALINLADEYTPALLFENSKNCKISCDGFELKEGCYPGCSENKYYRSINQGIMRTLSSSEFGAYNEKIINEILSTGSKAFITGKAITQEESCVNKEYYLIHGYYNEKTNAIELKNKELQTGCSGNYNSGDFQYEITSSGGEIILKEQFNPQLIFVDGEKAGKVEIDGEVFKSDIDFFMTLPVIENTKLQITKDDKTLLELNLGEDPGNRPCRK